MQHGKVLSKALAQQKICVTCAKEEGHWRKHMQRLGHQAQNCNLHKQGLMTPGLRLMLFPSQVRFLVHTVYVQNGMAYKWGS